MDSFSNSFINILWSYYIMVDFTAYAVIAFYGLLAIITAAIGNHLDNKNGFSNGYVVGVILSLVLWFTVGRKMAKA